MVKPGGSSLARFSVGAFEWEAEGNVIIIMIDDEDDNMVTSQKASKPAAEICVFQE